ncbi:MAG TPA: hypothetical protein VNJ02_13555 [Vicinamibacterales bacterium]|nr:hypothetical protein [Vicinamibacterales bacterium]
MTLRPTLPSSDTVDPPIAHHYVLILIIQVIVLLGLAWLAAHYR